MISAQRQKCWMRGMHVHRLAKVRGRRSCGGRTVVGMTMHNKCLVKLGLVDGRRVLEALHIAIIARHGTKITGCRHGHVEAHGQVTWNLVGMLGGLRAQFIICKHGIQGGWST